MSTRKITSHHSLLFALIVIISLSTSCAGTPQPAVNTLTPIPPTEPSSPTNIPIPMTPTIELTATPVFMVDAETLKELGLDSNVNLQYITHGDIVYGVNENGEKVILKYKNKWYTVESVVGRELEIISEDAFDTSYKGVKVKGSCQVDVTAKENGISAITCPDKVGGELLSGIAFNAWFQRGTVERAKTDLPTKEDRKIFDELMQRMQAGDSEATRQLVTTIYTYNGQYPSKAMEPVQVVFFPVETKLPEGVIAINNIDLPLVRGYGEIDPVKGGIRRSDMPRMGIMGIGGSGYEVILAENGKLIIKVGMTFGVKDASFDWNVANTYFTLPEWMRRNNGGSFNLNESMFVDFSRKWVSDGFAVK